MKTYTVVFSPLAETQLTALYRYIRHHATDRTARRYVNAVAEHCEGLSTFPHRGALRDDVRPGIRITNYKGRTVLVFDVDDAAMIVSILGVYYGGQDYEAQFRLDLDS
jgi:plasmid stabilization system protein ParE